MSLNRRLDEPDTPEIHLLRASAGYQRSLRKYIKARKFRNPHEQQAERLRDSSDLLATGMQERIGKIATWGSLDQPVQSLNPGIRSFFFTELERLLGEFMVRPACKVFDSSFKSYQPDTQPASSTALYDTWTHEYVDRLRMEKLFSDEHGDPVVKPYRQVLVEMSQTAVDMFSSSLEAEIEIALRDRDAGLRI